MAGKYSIGYVQDWRQIPGAIWVHGASREDALPLPANPPPAVLHKGYPVLHVEFDKHELQFCSAAQLAHYIEVLSRPRLPTSRQLSESSGVATGPNQHWLSRLPAALKSPRKRAALVKALVQAHAFIAADPPSAAFRPRGLTV